MPRLTRPRRAAEALVNDESLSIDSFESSSSPSHPLDAALEALRSLPTFRMMTSRPQPPFASLSWPFHGGEAKKSADGERQSSDGDKAPSASVSAPSASTWTSSSSSNSSPALPAIPGDLLKKASALEKTTDKSLSPAAPITTTTTKQTDENNEESSPSSFSLWPPRFPSLPSRLPSLPLLVSLSAPGGDPDKRRLLSVAEFFEGARATSRGLWRELDGDGDGWVGEGDVARALAARGLPASYAPRVLAAARGRGRWWATRVSRREFAAWMERGEPRALRAFTSMALDRSGRLDVSGVKDVLKRSGVAATDDAAKGVLRALRSGEDGAASYAQFRSFVALLPQTAMAAGGGGGAKTAARKNYGDDYDDDDDDFSGGSGGGSGGGAGGFDPATAWFDAASIVPLVSGTPALDEAAAAAAAAVAAASPSGKRAAATRAAKRAAAAATAAATTTAAAAAPGSSSSSSSSPTKAERARARKKQRAALLRAALAGGIASGATTLALFPLDTLKTRLQASGSSVAAKAAAAAAGAAGPAAAAASTSAVTLSSVVREGLLDKRALYRGVVPASLGSFFSHGLRTFSYEAALMVLTAAGFAGAAATGAAGGAAGGAAAASAASAAAAAVSSQLRLQALASAAGTAIGTCVRIPTEVLKQRLQVGLHANALDAARAAKEAGGLPWSLFAGTGATLAREVPFYAAGMAAYEVLKNVADGSASSPTR